MSDENDQKLVISVDKGVWTKENARDIPEGALTYARNCEYRGLSKGLSQRRGTAWATAGISGQGTIYMLAHFRRFADSTDKVIILGWNSIFSLHRIMTANTDGVGLMTFSVLETYTGGRIFTRPTSLTYNDIFYWCGSGDTPEAWNGTTLRDAGIANPIPAQVPSVIPIAGTGITVANAFHFTYRFRNSTDDVTGELINGNNIALFASYSADNSSPVQGFQLIGLPTTSPITGVDKIDVFMSLDEKVPSVFYLMETLTIGDAPRLRPTARTVITQGTTLARNLNFAFDSNPGTAATFINDNRTSASTQGEYHYITFAAETRADWLVEVDYSYGVTGGAPGDTTIDFSQDGGFAWTNIVTLNSASVGFTTGSGVVVGSISSTLIIVRIKPHGYPSGGLGKQTNTKIYDIRLTATTGSGRVTIGRIPSGTEEFINDGSFGHFQPPPPRIFPYTFEGHLLGVSSTNGLWLAYSETDRAEAWSTDPGLAAFPFLIPFKDKEVDEIVGAAPIRNQLIVFCKDSVWRINHLPVMSDPEADTVELFEETRSITKQRLTDSFGCVHEKAYTIIQMANDQDVVFFWSRFGPAVTDGNKVWKVSDHYDWSSFGSGLQPTVTEIFNDSQNSSVYVIFNTYDLANRGSFALTFYYGASHVMEVTPDTIRMKILGPIQNGQTAYGWGPMLQVGSSGWVPDGTNTPRYIFVADATSVGGVVRLFRADEGTVDVDGVNPPLLQWATKEVGNFGFETLFTHAVVNYQGTGDEALTFGNQTMTPDVPIDSDPLQINGQGHSLIMRFGDNDTQNLTGFYVRSEDGALIQYPAVGESVTPTSSLRTINSVALFHRPTRPVAD